MFDENIKYYERELRDLRTAHTRGLGMVNFSEASATASQPATSNPSTYTAVATFSSGETFPPLVQFAALDDSYDQNPLAIGQPIFDSDNLTATVNITDYNISSPNPLPTVYAVASLPIVSLTIVGTN